MTYDSRPDTYAHILKVQANLRRAITELLDRQLLHDLSKLASPEREAFDAATPLLATTEYGTEEYKAQLRKIKPAIEHHNAHNRHHPEFHPDRVAGMNLIDLVEMLCDWKAAGERTKNNKGLAWSIEVNQARFGYSDELTRILLNTARDLFGDGA